LRALRAYPTRLRGTVIVAPDVDAETLADMDDAGVVGIRLNWIRRPSIPDVESAEYHRLFAAVRDLGWHVEIFLEGSKLADVLPLVRESGVDVVLDHFAAPGCSALPTRDLALKGSRAGDTWVKLSAPYRLGGANPQRYVDALLDAGGSRQLVWASDWPFVSYEDAIDYGMCVDWLSHWIADRATRKTILADTPAHLFHFDSSSPNPAPAGTTSHP
jgi:predicted TIM-barrel fold metal-dependent hydrolase